MMAKKRSVIIDNYKFLGDNTDTAGGTQRGIVRCFELQHEVIPKTDGLSVRLMTSL